MSKHRWSGMNRVKLIAIVLYSLVALITFASGLKFFLATEYFAYHAQASGMTWSSVDAGAQLLYLAGFKIIGAGFLTVALSLGFLIFFPFIKFNQRWSFYVIPLTGLVFWSIMLTTSLKVSVETQASVPWGGSLICVLMLLAAFLVSLFDEAPVKRSQNEKELS